VPLRSESTMRTMQEALEEAEKYASGSEAYWRRGILAAQLEEGRRRMEQAVAEEAERARAAAEAAERARAAAAAAAAAAVTEEQALQARIRKEEEYREEQRKRAEANAMKRKEKAERKKAEKAAAEAAAAEEAEVAAAVEAVAKAEAASSRLRMEQELSQMAQERAALALRMQEMQAQLGVVTEAASAVEDETLCLVCMDERKQHVMVPCMHVCVCEACAMRLLEAQTPLCPVCRTPVEKTSRVFI